MLHVARRLYRELAGGDPGRANRFELSEELIALLAGREWLLVVDEAQWLNRECIEYLRHLHDHPRTRFSLLLVGGDGCWRVLSREPMLRSRIYRRVRFAPMRPQTVMQVIPGYHPIYQNAPAEVLAMVDDRYAHGSFREWASFTHSALALCHEQNIATLTEPIGAGGARVARGRQARRSRVTPPVTPPVQIAHVAPTLASTAAVNRLHDVGNRVIVVHPTPGRGGEGVARDVLQALGPSKRAPTPTPVAVRPRLLPRSSQ